MRHAEPLQVRVPLAKTHSFCLIHLAVQSHSSIYELITGRNILILFYISGLITEAFRHISLHENSIQYPNSVQRYGSNSLHRGSGLISANKHFHCFLELG